MLVQGRQARIYEITEEAARSNPATQEILFISNVLVPSQRQEAGNCRDAIKTTLQLSHVRGESAQRGQEKNQDQDLQEAIKNWVQISHVLVQGWPRDHQKETFLLQPSANRFRKEDGHY